MAEVQQESPATLEGIRALMAQKTQEGKSKEIKELLQKYGAAKLSAVKPEDYPALMQEAQVPLLDQDDRVAAFLPCKLHLLHRIGHIPVRAFLHLVTVVIRHRALGAPF